MWVKRTDKEILKAKRDAKFWRMCRAILAGIFICLLTIFFRARGWSVIYPTNRIPFDEVPERIPSSLVFGVLIAWFVYRFPLKIRRTMVCAHCGATKFEDSEYKCSCGGHFENLENMKWIGRKKHE
jgi:hypothetical protein